MITDDNDVYQTIELFIAGRNLKDLDYVSKSDPYVKVSYKRDFKQKNFCFLGKTETIPNNLNPTYQQSFVIQYIFESRQDIKFEVYDEDEKGHDDFIGSVQTTVGALMGAKNQTSVLDLMKGEKNHGKLIIRCEQILYSKFEYSMKWKAANLINTDSYFNFWDRSDPYLKLFKNRKDNTWVPVHKTEIIMDNLSPDWQGFNIDAYRLHNEENDTFKVQCWDWQKSGKDQFIGEIEISVEDLKKSNFPKQLTLLNNKIKKNPGSLVLERFKQVEKPNFVDYLRGGLELNMMIAIDFTASNGDPKTKTSLHHMSSQKKNHYQTAIEAIGQILLNYDTDKKIPAFGFGANVCFPKLNGLSHCFPLSGDFKNLDSQGIPNLMGLYKNAMKCLTMSGPTYFGPIIEYAAKISEVCKAKGQHIYQTLLILTDGEIHDMTKVVDLIIKSTDLPLSIIIVGVGQANFSNMVKLDGDSGLVGSFGKKASRDIVQFVPFRDVDYNPNILAKNLLGQLPGQVVQYFQSIGVNPRKPEKQQKLSDFLMNPEDLIQYAKITEKLSETEMFKSMK